MEVIYKGTLYEVPITSPVQLNGARLYNLAMQEVIVCAIQNEVSVDGVWKYDMLLSPAETAAIPQGVYNLELYSLDADSNPILTAYYENYAKVKESSFTKEYS